MLLKYIRENWIKTIRHKNNSKGLELPFPFTVPCIEERFTCFFYWDTYFTNLGLLHDNCEQAKNNINNMKFFVDTLGYIPNGNEEVMFNRSQPPLYAHAVMDYYMKTKDMDFVAIHYPSIKKEYSFWMQNRITKIGLNQYGANPSEKEVEDFYTELSGRGIIRLSDNPPQTDILHYFAEAESGWDFSPRYKGKALDFVQVDLNSILYEAEIILSKFARLLGNTEEASAFENAARYRKALMEKYLRDEYGLFHDYNFQEDKQSEFVTGASLLPFTFGVSDNRNACLETLEHLEFEFGVSVGEEKTGGQGFQWAYPNMWPPLVYWAYKAMATLHLREDAVRIAEKYLQTVESNFKATSRLWEKYDVVTGDVSNIEYESPPMMGWSAGVYVYLRNQKV